MTENRHELVDLRFEPLAIGFAHAIEEHHPVQVIGLVLHDPRRQFVEVHGKSATVQIVGLDSDRLKPLHLAIELGHAQASLLALGRTRLRREFGIEEHEFLIGQIGVTADIDDEKAKRQSDLVGRQPDSLRLVHQFEHLPHGPPQRTADAGNRTGLPAKRRVRVMHDLHDVADYMSVVPSERVQEIPSKPLLTPTSAGPIVPPLSRLSPRLHDSHSLHQPVVGPRRCPVRVLSFGAGLPIETSLRPDWKGCPE